MNQIVTKEYIRDFVKFKPVNQSDLRQAKRKLATLHGTTIIANSVILKKYRQLFKSKLNNDLISLLRKREIRTLSGIAPITVLTKPYPCPGRCVYCPAPKGMPKSYIASEPAAQRAYRLKFDPYRQVDMRIKALEANGHNADKIELIILGGTWSFYKPRYQEWFIKRCFEAANGRASKTLTQTQKINEKTKHRIIGLSLETRPDHVTLEELWRMRRLGCTHVQIGIQTLHQDILDLIKRDDTLANMARATALLRDFGFKITYHLMPGLPGSTPVKDLSVFKKIFSDPRWQPDMLKIYPCVVVKNSLLYQWFKKGKYKPYSDKVLVNLLIKIKKLIPPYVRINRLIRDIPSPEIMAGNLVTNLRQLLHEQGVVCKCIRCREARKTKVRLKDIKLVRRVYKAGQGTEYFISFESKDQKKLYAFVRLRLPFKTGDQGVGALIDQQQPKSILNSQGAYALARQLPFNNQTALIRELHTYGELIPVGSKKKAVQHAGLGKRLMKQAEGLAKQKGYKKLAVISGIGVRGYYKKLGYRLSNTYMVKKIK